MAFDMFSPVDRFIEDLPVALTQQEIVCKSRDLAAALDRRDSINAKKKVAASTFKEQITEVESEIDELAKCISSGKEVRPVECYETQRLADRMIDIRRCDSNAVIRSRPMTIDERQLALKDITIREADTMRALENQRRAAEEAAEDAAADAEEQKPGDDGDGEPEEDEDLDEDGEEDLDGDDEDGEEGDEKSAPEEPTVEPDPAGTADAAH